MSRFLIILGVLSVHTYAAEWPQWRGLYRTGEIASKTKWPNKLDESVLQEAWSVELAPSYSTPIVVGNRVFITETRNEETENVSAYDRQTGEKLWEIGWPGAMTVPFFAASNGSWIRATPAADGNHLYVAGIRDVLVCLEQATGTIVWKVDFTQKLESPLPSFGFASSPLIMGDYVYVQAGGGFVKLNKSTGEVVWRVLEDGGGMGGSAFSSPMPANIDGVEQILVQTRTHLTGVDPESGNVFWKQEIEAFRGMNIVTPVVYGDAIFTSAYGGKSLLLKPTKTSDGWQVETLWENKLQGYMSTPVLSGDHVYLHLRNQRFASINMKTGEENWITKPFGKYWSLVSNGDKLLALDERGDLLLVTMSPDEFKLIDSRHISDASTWAHLVVADSQVFVRSLNKLTVYDLRDK